MNSHLLLTGTAAPSSPKVWALQDSGLTVFHGLTKTARLFHFFLPQAIARGKQVLCLDGANRFDPLLVARLARQRGREPSEFYRRLRVARAFTCFQLTELLLRVPRIRGDFPAEILVVTALPDLYFDEDVREREAAASFRQALEALRALARLPLPVAVFSDASSLPTPRRSFFQQLTAQANQVWKCTKQEDGHLAFLSEKVGPHIQRLRP